MCQINVHARLFGTLEYPEKATKIRKKLHLSFYITKDALRSKKYEVPNKKAVLF